MTLDLPNRLPSESASCRDVKNALYQTLEAALIRECAQRYDTGVALRPERVSDSGAEMRLHVICGGKAKLPVQLEVEHVGGNVYEVISAVEDGPTNRFVQCIWVEDGNAPSQLPTLGKKLTEFLLAELEKHLGQKVLS